MGFYRWLHDLLFHLLSAPRSCWPEAGRANMKSKSKKYGGVKRENALETMALAGVLARGYDDLRPQERRFVRISDEYDMGMMTSAELYSQLQSFVDKKPWDRHKYFRAKKKINSKMLILNRV